VGNQPIPEQQSTKKGIKYLLGAGGLVLLFLVGFGIWNRATTRSNPQQQPSQPEPTTVSIVRPAKISKTFSLSLPGETMAYTDAPIFAQTSGYLHKWNFDIGAKVKAGDILAEIDTPEIDQQLNQARAQLKVAQSARDLSEATYKREKDLFDRHVIANQDYDTAADTDRANEATVIADQANVGRLEALEAFKIVRVPFNGVVTARNTDVGAFVAAGSGMQLFRIAKISPLRIYVNVPQDYAQFVKEGTDGELMLSEFPGRTFEAHVVSTAGVIDQSSRTLLTQLQTPNKTGELLPGAYADVKLNLQRNSGIVKIPTNTMLFRSEGTAVGVVHPDGKIEIRKITISRDLGGTLEVSQGLSETDQVVVNPSDSLTDGALVQVAKSNKLLAADK
jgi:RND family efflux transporter MFP subunit